MVDVFWASAKRTEYIVWSRSRVQADSEDYWATRRHAQLVYVDAERVFTERSKSLLTKHLIHESDDLPLRRRFWCEL